MRNSTYFCYKIKELKKQVRQGPNLPEKLAIQKKIKGIQKNRDEAWREYDVAAKEIEWQKDKLIDEVESRLTYKVGERSMFTVKWRIV